MASVKQKISVSIFSQETQVTVNQEVSERIRELPLKDAPPASPVSARKDTIQDYLNRLSKDPWLARLLTDNPITDGVPHLFVQFEHKGIEYSLTLAPKEKQDRKGNLLDLELFRKNPRKKGFLGSSDISTTTKPGHMEELLVADDVSLGKIKDAVNQKVFKRATSRKEGLKVFLSRLRADETLQHLIQATGAPLDVEFDRVTEYDFKHEVVNRAGNKSVEFQERTEIDHYTLRITPLTEQEIARLKRNGSYDVLDLTLFKRHEQLLQNPDSPDKETLSSMSTEFKNSPGEPEKILTQEAFLPDTLKEALNKAVTNRLSSHSHSDRPS
ncbi:MAG: hypothetical protein ABH950_06330 [Candidatus Altiarchaeota archaeon]